MTTRRMASLLLSSLAAFAATAGKEDQRIRASRLVFEPAPVILLEQRFANTAG